MINGSSCTGGSELILQVGLDLEQHHVELGLAVFVGRSQLSRVDEHCALLLQDLNRLCERRARLAASH